MSDRRQRVTAVAAAMVLLGLAQTAWGGSSGDYVAAALGATFAVLGVLFYVAER